MVEGEGFVREKLEKESTGAINRSGQLRLRSSVSKAWCKLMAGERMGESSGRDEERDKFQRALRKTLVASW
jgi:hypothetical protein